MLKIRRIFYVSLVLHTLSLVFSSRVLAIDYRTYAHGYTSWEPSRDDPKQRQWSHEAWVDAPATVDIGEEDGAGLARLANYWSDLWTKKRLFHMARIMEHASGRYKKGAKKAAKDFLEFHQSFPRNFFHSGDELSNFLLFLESDHHLDEYPDAKTLRTFIGQDGRHLLEQFRKTQNQRADGDER